MTRLLPLYEDHYCPLAAQLARYGGRVSHVVDLATPLFAAASASATDAAYKETLLPSLAMAVEQMNGSMALQRRLFVRTQTKKAHTLKEYFPVSVVTCPKSRCSIQQALHFRYGAMLT